MTMQQYFNFDTQKVKSLTETYGYLLQSAGEQKGKLIGCLYLAFFSSVFFGIAIALLYPLFKAMETQHEVVFYFCLIVIFLLFSIVLRIAAGN